MTLAELVQEKLAAGQIPREPCVQTGTAGEGLGNACSLCEKQIFSVAGWYKLRNGAIFWFHEVGSGLMHGGEPEQRLEGGHRRATPIEAEGKFVQVDLEVGVTKVGASQPGLQVPEDPVDTREQLFGTAGVPLGAQPVAIAQRAEGRVARAE